MVIKFFFNDSSIRIPERRKLKQYIITLFKKEGKFLFSLNYVFCSDKYLLSVNKEFLRQDNYTDIITFRLSEPSDPIVGEIYISTQRVKNNASQFGSGLNE